MTFSTFLFYAFSAILVFAALRVITARNPVHAALFLVLAFFTSACLWILLQAEFLAISLVLVYVGAVMVLFLFVVMMLDINIDQLREGFWRYLPVGAFVGVVVAAEMILVLKADALRDLSAVAARPEGYSNTRELGLVLYTEYVFAFELAAVILLVAIVAAIALTLRRRKDSKYQDPSRQVRVRREDRIRIVSMKSETQASREAAEK